MKTLNTYITEWKANSSTANNISKSKHIFMHEVPRSEYHIKIFSGNWAEFNTYKDKVYINDCQIKLRDDGCTEEMYDYGTYEIEIKDIDNVTNCQDMFYNCSKLSKAPVLPADYVESYSYYYMF